jgi:hypothetical protein
LAPTGKIASYAIHLPTGDQTKANSLGRGPRRRPTLNPARSQVCFVELEIEAMHDQQAS